MRAAMERREAPGLLARARAPRDPHLPQAPWVPEAWRVAGRSQCRPRERIATLPGRLPALHPSPLGERRKTGRRAQPGVRKTKPRHSGALAVWIFVSHTTGVIPGRERKRANPESRQTGNPDV